MLRFTKFHISFMKYDQVLSLPSSTYELELDHITHNVFLCLLNAYFDPDHAMLAPEWGMYSFLSPIAG
jgi:hypothetical protein